MHLAIGNMLATPGMSLGGEKGQGRAGRQIPGLGTQFIQLWELSSEHGLHPSRPTFSKMEQKLFLKSEISAKKVNFSSAKKHVSNACSGSAAYQVASRIQKMGPHRGQNVGQHRLTSQNCPG